MYVSMYLSADYLSTFHALNSYNINKRRSDIQLVHTSKASIVPREHQRFLNQAQAIPLSNTASKVPSANCIFFTSSTTPVETQNTTPILAQHTFHVRPVLVLLCHVMYHCRGKIGICDVYVAIVIHICT